MVLQTFVMYKRKPTAKCAARKSMMSEQQKLSDEKLNNKQFSETLLHHMQF